MKYEHLRCKRSQRYFISTNNGLKSSSINITNIGDIYWILKQTQHEYIFILHPIFKVEYDNDLTWLT